MCSEINCRPIKDKEKLVERVGENYILVNGMSLIIQFAP